MERKSKTIIRTFSEHIIGKILFKKILIINYLL